LGTCPARMVAVAAVTQRLSNYGAVAWTNLVSLVRLERQGVNRVAAN
jgi:hypothetical protein